MNKVTHLISNHPQRAQAAAASLVACSVVLVALGLFFALARSHHLPSMFSVARNRILVSAFTCGAGGVGAILSLALFYQAKRKREVKEEKVETLTPEEVTALLDKQSLNRKMSDFQAWFNEIKPIEKGLQSFNSRLKSLGVPKDERQKSVQKEIISERAPQYENLQEKFKCLHTQLKPIFQAFLEDSPSRAEGVWEFLFYAHGFIVGWSSIPLGYKEQFIKKTNTYYESKGTTGIIQEVFSQIFAIPHPDFDFRPDSIQELFKNNKEKYMKLMELFFWDCDVPKEVWEIYKLCKDLSKIEHHPREAIPTQQNLPKARLMTIIWMQTRDPMKVKQILSENPSDEIYFYLLHKHLENNPYYDYNYDNFDEFLLKYTQQNPLSKKSDGTFDFQTLLEESKTLHLQFQNSCVKVIQDPYKGSFGAYLDELEKVFRTYLKGSKDKDVCLAAFLSWNDPLKGITLGKQIDVAKALATHTKSSGSFTQLLKQHVEHHPGRAENFFKKLFFEELNICFM